MTEQRGRASLEIAQAVLDGLPPADRAAVEAEARDKDVEPVEIVRVSLDILIAQSELPPSDS